MTDLLGLAWINVPADWEHDWLWGLPLIVFTVVIHVMGLETVRQGFLRAIGHHVVRRYPRTMFVGIVGCMTLSATVLHAIEAVLWACAYLLLNALPSRGEAMLYSLNAITSYGHASLRLEGRWELMGAMEALDGWLLFGLSTAFLFAVIEKVWSSGNKARDSSHTGR